MGEGARPPGGWQLPRAAGLPLLALAAVGALFLTALSVGAMWMPAIGLAAHTGTPAGYAAARALLSAGERLLSVDAPPLLVGMPCGCFVAGPFYSGWKRALTIASALTVPRVQREAAGGARPPSSAARWTACDEGRLGSSSTVS